MIVKLLVALNGVNAGEVAGFSDEAAAKLIADGKAAPFVEGMELRSKPDAPSHEPVVLRMAVAAEGLSAGEVAGFHPDVAKRLVEQGKASVYEIDPDVEVVNMDEAARARRDKEVERARAKAKEAAEEEERKRQIAERAAERERRAAEEKKAREEAALKKAEEKKKADEEKAAKKAADKLAKGTQTKGGR
jgi:type IV secretory pathway VirB10-like protein